MNITKRDIGFILIGMVILVLYVLHNIVIMNIATDGQLVKVEPNVVYVPEYHETLVDTEITIHQESNGDIVVEPIV